MFLHIYIHIDTYTHILSDQVCFLFLLLLHSFLIRGFSIEMNEMTAPFVFFFLFPPLGGYPWQVCVQVCRTVSESKIVRVVSMDKCVRCGLLSSQ